jgi:hypothetical protein
MRLFLLLLFLAPAACWTPLARAQEIVTLDTRPGVTQSFFIANMGGVQAQAAALLFIGGGGYIRLRMENGRPAFGAQNFLPRSRAEFIRNGILPVIMDNPSDQHSHEGMNDAFRASAAHAADIRAVVAEVKRRYPGLPVFLVGTSRSTISVAHLGRALGDEVTGAVLSSSLFYAGRRSALAGFDFSSIKVPLLFVHHREDACESTPFADAVRLGEKFPLVSVKGGKPPESGPCDPFAAHGFFGKEPETVDAIAAWMLKKPYRKDIE